VLVPFLAAAADALASGATAPFTGAAEPSHAQLQYVNAVHHGAGTSVPGSAAVGGEEGGAGPAVAGSKRPADDAAEELEPERGSAGGGGSAIIKRGMLVNVSDDEEDDDEGGGGKKGAKKRKKIEIKYIEDKSRRHITFSKRRMGIFKKAFELAKLTKAQVLLMVASETGNIHTYATPKFQNMTEVNEGEYCQHCDRAGWRETLEACLNADEVAEEDEQEEQEEQEDAADASAVAHAQSMLAAAHAAGGGGAAAAVTAIAPPHNHGVVMQHPPPSEQPYNSYPASTGVAPLAQQLPPPSNAPYQTYASEVQPIPQHEMEAMLQQRLHAEIVTSEPVEQKPQHLN
jgi:MADS-box transcription factor